MNFNAGTLTRRIRIESPVSDDGFDGAGSGAWQLVAEVSASVQDLLPSRGERIAEGINAAARPARVRIRYRPGIDASMRVLIGHNSLDEPYWVTERTAQIITMPAELGHRIGLEFMIEDYTSAGNPA